MSYHYEYYEEDFDKANAINNLLILLSKMKLGVKHVELSISWGGDITLTVAYLPSRFS